MWLSGKGAAQPTWIQYEFGRVEKLDKMLVWNSNQALESILGVGAKDVKIEYSTDDENWTALGDFEFTQAAGAAGYTPDISVDFAGVPAQFVKLTISSNWGGILAQYGLAEVRFYYVPVTAREPQPAADANEVNPQVNFSWRAGREAASHKVYVSDDQQAVIDGTASAAAVSGPEYETSLMLDTTYYWKVTEVNEAEAITAWDSEVWSFSTGSFVAVEDFESYTDKEGGRIYEFWVDGYEDAANGSLVGYGEAPFAEQTVLHGGKQSMPLAYDNSGSATYSEAKLTFDAPQDWTQHGITTLVVFFRGQSSNSKSSVYLKINDTKVAFNGAAATAMPLWKQWNIPLAAISGLKSVKSLTIGVEGAGAGTLFVDDIRLYAAAPEVIAPADPGTTGLTAYYKMEDNVQDSSGKNYHGTLTSGSGYDVGYRRQGPGLQRLQHLRGPAPRTGDQYDGRHDHRHIRQLQRRHRLLAADLRLRLEHHELHVPVSASGHNRRDAVCDPHHGGRRADRGFPGRHAARLAPCRDLHRQRHDDDDAVPRRRAGGPGRHDPAAQGPGQHDPELAGPLAVHRRRLLLRHAR